MQPLISVILTSYNQPELLERAFDSLINQSYKNIEIIIVDDCSADKGNQQLIEHFKQLHPNQVIAVYQTSNVGIPKNKNTGFRLAKGEYITYLDGDDTYYKDKIAAEIETFAKQPDVDIVYSNYDIKEFDGNVLKIWASKKQPEGYIFKDIVANNFSDFLNPRYEMFKKQVMQNLDFYDEQFSVYHDLDFMLHYSLNYKVAYCNYTGSSYYKNPESIVFKTKKLELINQQIQVYNKYLPEIKKQHLEKEFSKYLNKIDLSKLFYSKNINYGLFFQTAFKQPLKLIKLARIYKHLKSQKA